MGFDYGNRIHGTCPLMVKSWIEKVGSNGPLVSLLSVLASGGGCGLSYFFRAPPALPVLMVYDIARFVFVMGVLNGV